MKKIPDNSVDMILTSPPYNMNLRVRKGREYSTQVLPGICSKYKDFKDNLTMPEYYEFTKGVLTECLRVSDLVFYNVQFLTGNKTALFKIIGEFSDKMKEVIIWDKTHAQPAVRAGIMNSQFEVLLVLQNSRPYFRLFETAEFDRGTLSNIWHIKKGKKLSKDHGAIFPEELAEKVISNFSAEGATVLDPFMGTGTTGVVCKRLKRDFIGIELGRDCFAFAKKRIKESK